MSGRPIVLVDQFAGAGGTSTGALRALARLGRPVKLLAINHWKEAIDTHALNHPDVHHMQEDLSQIDPREAMDRFDLGRTIDLLWASPECTSHSYSRGGRPISEQSRSSAWHPLKWADQLNVKKIIIENVPSFRAWGPTNGHGKAIKARRGETYRQYLDMLRAMGYTVDARVLNAADYGAAQTRKRLFILAVKGTRRIFWPVASHAKPGNLFGLPPHRGAKEIIDWSLQGKSIFNRKKPMARKSLERIVIGGEKFWTALRPYMPILRQHLLARGIDEPLPTVAAGGLHIGLAEPVLTSVSHGDMSGRVRPVSEPLPTVTGSREMGIAEAIVVGTEFSKGNGDYVRTVEDPLRTLTSRGGVGVAKAETFVMKIDHAFGQKGGVVRDVDEPLSTVTTKNGLGVVEPFLTKYHGDHGELGDGAKRVKSVDEPLGTVDASNRFGLVEAVPFTLPHRVFDNMTAHSIDEPIHTVTSKGVPALVEPVITEGVEEIPAGPAVIIAYNGERPGQTPRTHSIEEPLPTVCNGTKGLSSPVLLKYNRTGGARSVDEPLSTLTAKPRYGLVAPEVLARLDALPVGTVTAWGLKIAPNLYLDILFRMLRVHELGQGQGFDRDYQFTGTVEDQVRQVGNAVHVDIAEALVFSVLA